MLYLVRLENLMYIVQTHGRKVNGQNVGLVISNGTGSGCFAHETFRSKTFRPKHAKCSSLDVSSHNS